MTLHNMVVWIMVKAKSNIHDEEDAKDWRWRYHVFLITYELARRCGDFGTCIDDRLYMTDWSYCITSTFSLDDLMN